MKSIIKKIVIYILTLEAKLVLKKYKPRIIAVTGNVGKTSAKDAIFTVLSGHFHTRKSLKSFNSDIGVPLTILGLPNAWNNPFSWLQNLARGASLLIVKAKYPEWLILEVGADRPGDIARVATWLHPDISVLTHISKVPVHIEYFESREAVIAEKAELLRATKPGGTMVLFADNEDVMQLREISQARVFSYGFSPDATVSASNDTVIYDEKGMPEGTAFKINVDGSSVPVGIMGAIGRQHIFPALAAIAVAHSQGLNLVSISETFNSHETPPGRMKILPGINGSVLIDDSYNASPVAVEEALKTLSTLNCAGKKIVALGDMLELGKYSVEEHRRLGRMVGKLAHLLVVVGVRARFFAEGARGARMKAKNIYEYDTSDIAAEALPDHVAEGDIVLIKGSQGARMERITKALLREPEKAGELLVRQDEEWRKR
jgi:UDP-N-acetylmuramoyl-tripeptide--D-alanyl-D-alanine ligase